MAYLQITLKISAADRAAAADAYQKFKAPFLETIAGAPSRALSVGDEGTQVLHGSDDVLAAKACLETQPPTADIIGRLDAIAGYRGGCTHP